VAPRDTAAMTAALEALWRSPRLRREMGDAGRERVESGFALAWQIPQIAALYEQVARAPLGDPKAGAPSA
jgi:glycosyltransferase involved in cell wall biosynthesis